VNLEERFGNREFPGVCFAGKDFRGFLVLTRFPGASRFPLSDPKVHSCTESEPGGEAHDLKSSFGISEGRDCDQSFPDRFGWSMVPNPYRLPCFTPSSAQQAARLVCWNQRYDERGRMLSGLLQAEELHPQPILPWIELVALSLPLDRPEGVKSVASDQRSRYPGTPSPHGSDCSVQV
jgi:hypothetical protein